MLTLLLLMPQEAPHQHGDMSQFAHDKRFQAAHTLRANHAQLLGKNIEIPVNGGKAKAYWDEPKAGHHQAILMVHEWWGLNDNIKETADRLRAATGYGVLAVDLYEGKVATTAEEAGKDMAAVNQQKASATVNAALKALRNGTVYKASGLGTIGYCFGGGWSHKAAIMGGDSVKACVIYYGMPTTAPDELARLKAPVLMVWGTKDKWINREVVKGFEGAMTRAGKSLETVAYDADHAFANPSSASYQSSDAKSAWEKTVAFFKKHLG